MKYAVSFVLALVLVLEGLNGCSLLDPSDVIKSDTGVIDLRITTDTTVYTPDQNGWIRIGVTFENIGAEPVYYNLGIFPQPHYFLLKQVGGEWVMAFNGPVPAILVAPKRVDPGQVIKSGFGVNDADRIRESPLWRVDTLPGVYRLSAWVQATPGTEENGFRGDPVPFEEHLSNPFTIEE
jgi:hypothetical protein